MAKTPYVARANKYYRRSRITEWKFRQLVSLFALDLSASDTARLTGLTTKTVNSIYLKIRARLAEVCERESPFSSGEVEVDESYFGARRVRGKRGRGASGKTPVFGLLKRNGKVYTEIVPNCSKASLQAIIRGRVAPEVVIHSDGWRGYDGLVDVGYARHFRVEHGSNEFVVGARHINGIESMASRAFGALPNAACKSSMVCLLIPFICISKSVNGASTSEILTFIRSCSNYLDNTQFKHLNYLRPYKNYQGLRADEIYTKVRLTWSVSHF